MTGLPPREARLLSLAEVNAWGAALESEAAHARLNVARAQAQTGPRRRRG
jgi:hypothetical protein